ncbi:MAG: transcriptional regulator [Desulfovibrionaceae bacterium]
MSKLLVLLIAGAVIYFLFKGDQKKKQLDKKGKPAAQPVQNTGDMVKDPVCGAYVKVDSEIRVREGDTLHRFCSYECRDKFLASKGYVKPEVKEKEEA